MGTTLVGGFASIVELRQKGVNSSKRISASQRRFLRWVWIYFLHFTGLLNWVVGKIATSSGIVVLTFHRVLPDPQFETTNSPPGMVVRKQTFEALISYLHANCEIVALSGVSPDWKSSSQRPRVAVTFDDGWKDMVGIAHPIVLKYGVPVTVFVCPGLVGQQRPFWPEQVSRAWSNAATSKTASDAFSIACAEWFKERRFEPSLGRGLHDLIIRLKGVSPEQRKGILQRLSAIGESAKPSGQMDSSLEATLSWQDVSALNGEGCTFGSHSHTHEILTVLKLEEARQELRESKEVIETILASECRMFAYPNGSWSHKVRDLVAQLGYSQAFINEPGIWRPETDSCLIPRINVWEGSLTSVHGHFSAPVFQYAVFWRAYWEGLRKNRG